MLGMGGGREGWAAGGMGAGWDMWAAALFIQPYRVGCKVKKLARTRTRGAGGWHYISIIMLNLTGICSNLNPRSFFIFRNKLTGIGWIGQ